MSTDLKEAFSLGGLGVKELCRRVVAEAQKDNCFAYAAALAYYFLFAFFPFFIFLTALLGFLHLPNLMDHLTELLAKVLPGEAMMPVEEQLAHLTSRPRAGLLSFGILAALWTSSSAIVAVADALNHAYNVDESRPFWKLRGIAILLTMGFSLFIIASIVLLMFGPQIGGWIAGQIGLGSAFEIAWNILRWPVILFLVMTAVAALYYFTPDVEQQWEWISPGSVFAVLLWLVASLGFSYYVNNFGEYDATYGSIGAIIVLMTWMYVGGLVILIGGEINAEIENASRRGKNKGEKSAA